MKNNKNIKLNLNNTTKYNTNNENDNYIENDNLMLNKSLDNRLHFNNCDKAMFGIKNKFYKKYNKLLGYKVKKIYDDYRKNSIDISSKNETKINLSHKKDLDSTINKNKPIKLNQNLNQNLNKKLINFKKDLSSKINKESWIIKNKKKYKKNYNNLYKVNKYFFKEFKFE